MARYFLDSSAIVKYYHIEIGSTEVQRILGEAGSEHLIARLTWVEILSGLARKVRMGVILAADYGQLERRLRADIRQRLLRPMRMLNAHLATAGDLVGTHGLSRQLRALDALQLAVALGIHRVMPLDYFVCADQRLCDVAALEGLAVINPELIP
jgi:predicted nucleic acid-binding protein